MQVGARKGCVLAHRHRAHTLELRARGVDYEMRETFKSGLEFGQRTLEALGSAQDLARAIAEDVEKRDAERLRIQQAEGLFAGGHMLHTRPVTPEPLTKPRRESKVINTAEDEEPAAEEEKQNT